MGDGAADGCAGSLDAACAGRPPAPGKHIYSFGADWVVVCRFRLFAALSARRHLHGAGQHDLSAVVPRLSPRTRIPRPGRGAGRGPGSVARKLSAPSRAGGASHARPRFPIGGLEGNGNHALFHAGAVLGRGGAGAGAGAGAVCAAGGRAVVDADSRGRILRRRRPGSCRRDGAGAGNRLARVVFPRISRGGRRRGADRWRGGGFRRAPPARLHGRRGGLRIGLGRELPSDVGGLVDSGGDRPDAGEK